MSLEALLSALFIGSTVATYHVVWVGPPSLGSIFFLSDSLAQCLRHLQQAQQRDTLASLFELLQTLGAKPTTP